MPYTRMPRPSTPKPDRGRTTTPRQQAQPDARTSTSKSSTSRRPPTELTDDGGISYKTPEEKEEVEKLLASMRARKSIKKEPDTETAPVVSSQSVTFEPRNPTASSQDITPAVDKAARPVTKKSSNSKLGKATTSSRDTTPAASNRARPATQQSWNSRLDSTTASSRNVPTVVNKSSAPATQSTPPVARSASNTERGQKRSASNTKPGQTVFATHPNEDEVRSFKLPADDPMRAFGFTNVVRDRSKHDSEHEFEDEEKEAEREKHNRKLDELARLQREERLRRDKEATDRAFSSNVEDFGPVDGQDEVDATPDNSQFPEHGDDQEDKDYSAIYDGYDDQPVGASSSESNDGDYGEPENDDMDTANQEEAEKEENNEKEEEAEDQFEGDAEQEANALRMQAKRDTVLVGTTVPNADNRVTNKMKKTLDLSDIKSDLPYIVKVDPEDATVWNLLRRGKVIISFNKDEREVQEKVALNVIPGLKLSMAEMIKEHLASISGDPVSKKTYLADKFLQSQADIFPMVFTGSENKRSIRSKTYNPDGDVRNANGQFSADDGTRKTLMATVKAKQRAQRKLTATSRRSEICLDDIYEQLEADEEEGKPYDPNEYNLPASWNLRDADKMTCPDLLYDSFLEVCEVARRDLWEKTKVIKETEKAVQKLVSTLGAILQGLIYAVDESIKLAPTMWMVKVLSPGWEWVKRSRNAADTGDDGLPAKRQKTT